MSRQGERSRAVVESMAASVNDFRCEFCGRPESTVGTLHFCHVLDFDMPASEDSGFALCGQSNQPGGCHYLFDYHLKPLIADVLNGSGALLSALDIKNALERRRRPRPPGSSGRIIMPKELRLLVALRLKKTFDEVSNPAHPSPKVRAVRIRTVTDFINHIG